MLATARPARHPADFLGAVSDEAAIIVACALIDPRDLLRLARACRRFATKCIAAPASHRCSASGGGAASPQQAEMWSIAEEAARRWIASCTDQERGWVPRRGRESWLGLMWEVESLRRGAAVLDRWHTSITMSRGGSRATRGGPQDYAARTAACKPVMRAGRHYAQFTVMVGKYMFFGVIRPGWDVERVRSEHTVCWYDTGSGYRWPEYTQVWEGMQGANEEGDRIGLLLDLDQGSITVYKNGARLGVMATDLSGEYCWAVTLSMVGNSARIESAALPAVCNKCGVSTKRVASSMDNVLVTRTPADRLPGPPTDRSDELTP
jgi:hypothetical protein